MRCQAMSTLMRTIDPTQLEISSSFGLSSVKLGQRAPDLFSITTVGEPGRGKTLTYIAQEDSVRGTANAEAKNTKIEAAFPPQKKERRP